LHRKHKKIHDFIGKIARNRGKTHSSLVGAGDIVSPRCENLCFWGVFKPFLGVFRCFLVFLMFFGVFGVFLVFLWCFLGDFGVFFLVFFEQFLKIIVGKK
jgi:hypothetical protein